MGMHSRSLLVVGVSLACGTASAQPCSSGQDLGTLPNGTFSWATAASADGSTIVGWSNVDGSVGQNLRGFRWTQSGGMQPIPTLGGNRSYAYGVSADGTVVVGEAYDSAGIPRAFRWTAAGGIQDIGTGPGRFYSVARAVSADGSVVVGEVLDAALNYHSFRWTAASGMQYLPTTASSAASRATAVAANGTRVVCEVRDEEGNDMVIIWDQTLGTFNLSLWAGLNRDLWIATGAGITADGNTVVGQEWTGPAGIRSYLWSLPNFHESLIDNPQGVEQNVANAISDNGGVVVGRAVFGAGGGGYVWTPTGAMRFLPPAAGYATSFATTVSGDGRVVAGWSSNNGAGQFHATRWSCGISACYANCDGNTGPAPLSPADFSCFLTKYRAGDSYADCDASSSLSPADFSCFLNKYRAGCP